MYGVRLPAGTGSDEGSLSFSLELGDVPDALCEPAWRPAPRAEPRTGDVPAATAVALFVTVAVTVVFGIWPAPLVDFVQPRLF